MRVYGVFRRLFFLDRIPLLPPACPMTETAVWQQSAWSKVSNHPYYQSKPPTWAAQFLCWKIQIIPCEFAFLSCQRHTIYILCIHDTCNQWWGCYTSFDKRRYFVGSYHSPAFRTAVYISRDLGDCRAKDVEEMNGHFLMFNKNIISINANPFLHRKNQQQNG